jgi:hypothetical protein
MPVLVQADGTYEICEHNLSSEPPCERAPGGLRYGPPLACGPCGSRGRVGPVPVAGDPSPVYQVSLNAPR